MYRAVTLYALKHGAVVDGKVDACRLEGMLDDINIGFEFNPARCASDIYLNGVCVEGKIRGIEVSNLVSRVSSLAPVRRKLVAMQQAMGKDKGVVMDGRDIGTVVFPEAEMKIFMTADVQERARRRYLELQAKGDNVTEAEVVANIALRDNEDIHREISPLRQAADAIVLDNSHMTLDEELGWFDREFKRITER